MQCHEFQRRGYEVRASRRLASLTAKEHLEVEIISFGTLGAHSFHPLKKMKLLKIPLPPPR